MPSLESRPSRLKLSPANECIYCGSSGSLSLEHIIPISLGGMIELPAASCESCAIIINDFEGKISGSTLREARAVAGIKTRRPKNRPSSVLVDLRFSGGRKKTVEVAIKEAPITFIAPFFHKLEPRPSFPDELRSYLSFEARHNFGFIEKVRLLKLKHGADGVTVKSTAIRPRDFGRLVWKITIGALWSFANASAADNDIRARVLNPHKQFLSKSAAAVEGNSNSNFQYSDLFSEYSLNPPQFAQIRLNTYSYELHRYIYSSIDFDRQLNLPRYVTRVRNLDQIRLTDEVISPEHS